MLLQGLMNVCFDRLRSNFKQNDGFYRTVLNEWIFGLKKCLDQYILILMDIIHSFHVKLALKNHSIVFFFSIIVVL